VAPYGRHAALLGFGLLVALALLLRRRLVAALISGRTRRIWLTSEAIFTVGYCGLALLRSFAPDVWNNEKPMDMAFVNAVSRSEWFPPHDPWQSGETLNYYYLGHYLVSLLVRTTGIAPEVVFNLAVALFFALVATAIFGLATELSLAFDGGRRVKRAIGVGSIAVGITLLLGNLAGAVELMDDHWSLSHYDWWSPSRVIDGTANEFPFFSFLLGDLHAHVMATGFTLVLVAYGLQLAIAGPPLRDSTAASVGELILAGLVLGWLCGVNTADFATAIAIVLAVIALSPVTGHHGPRMLVKFGWSVAVVGVGALFAAPFLIDFSPDVDGVALVRAHEPFTRFAAGYTLIYALPLWAIAAGFARRLAVPRDYLVWAGTALLVVLVLLAPSHLAGLFIVLSLTAVALYSALDTRLGQADRFFWLLVAAGLGLIAASEFVYIRDAFDGTPNYRYNTVFKTGYQAWFLLSVAAAVAIVWARDWLAPWFIRLWSVGLALLVLLLSVYPIAGSYARDERFSRTPSLDGREWLRRSAPDDSAALEWLEHNVRGAPVILESVGDDYNATGYGRVSTFTGLPTVLGWQGHELQWGHHPSSRGSDVNEIFATENAQRARLLLARYGVRYVFIGSLEHARYGPSALAKFDRLGAVVFASGRTRIYAVDPRALTLRTQLRGPLVGGRRQ
jgi:YYY domain-containing protein